MSSTKTIGVILAGGTSRRMQPLAASSHSATSLPTSNPEKNSSASVKTTVDKSLLSLRGTSLLQQVFTKAKAQVDTLVINTNSENTDFSELNCPIISDLDDFSFAGPLAGIHAAMFWALQCNAAKPSQAYGWLASFPVDSPFFPNDLVIQLINAAETQQKKMAHGIYRNNASPLFSVWSLELYEDLTRQLQQAERQVSSFLKRHASSAVSFDGYSQDPFYNINTPEDLANAEDHRD